MSATVLLIRHPPVANAWAGRCYGRSDMGLSREGMAIGRSLAGRFTAGTVDAIVHSGAIRTRRLALAIAAQAGVSAQADPGWLERDFAGWEGRRWQAIWRETGDLMDRMMTDPSGFRPGNGETGQELAQRAWAAWDRLPMDGTTLVVAHGGPIAAIRARHAGASLERMIDFVPRCGDVVVIPRRPGRDPLG